MAAAQPFNPRSPTMRRIMREAKELTDSPSADYTAAPLDSDIFEWHFTIRGPPNSAFSEGMYHGRIVLPAQYPLRPPNFRFTTPSGRFEVNREICLSISGFHEETWQPAWGIRTALVALRSFMETSADGQVGGIDASDSVKRSMAAASPSFRCATCRKTNAEIMSECEAAAAKHSGSSTPLVEVPSELKLAFKDELTSGKKPITDQEKEDADEEARLAEGFVQTAPVDTRPAAQLPFENVQAQPAPLAASHAYENQESNAFANQVQRHLQQHLQHHLQQVQQVQQQQQEQHQQSAAFNGQARAQRQPQPHLQDFRQPVQPMNAYVANDDDIPKWIDMAIAGLVCLLATLLLRWGYLDGLLIMM
ncbi:Ubiquitin-conjugating enzyme E2 J1 [Ceratocystis fimbriata CBS 114723]|uniref:Ubiquitin-conjugating enzyme E2 J1 n=1 Tax=Ceratocystis fimbriata CBS 114723 TaxID=1035309 RepID=A0A2C5WPK9_9PEZI|nr:Ubiquitin-conjugating enzyme E2 J1 [Ceratocystis fimbriata CBS 114723]